MNLNCVLYSGDKHRRVAAIESREEEAFVEVCLHVSDDGISTRHSVLHGTDSNGDRVVAYVTIEDAQRNKLHIFSDSPSSLDTIARSVEEAARKLRDAEDAQ